MRTGMDGDPYSFTESGELGMCLLLLLHKYIDPDLVVERGRLDDGVGVFLLLAKAAERFIAEHQFKLRDPSVPRQN